MSLPVAIMCPACGYDLRGLIGRESAKCPECGGGFAIEQLRAAGHRARRTFVWKLAATPFIIAVLAILGMFALIKMPPELIWLAVPAAVICVPFLAGVAWIYAAERRAGILAAGGAPPNLVRICSLLLSLVLAFIATILAAAIGYILLMAIAVTTHMHL